jgi:DNA-binding transcriptional LysR family regulator
MHHRHDKINIPIELLRSFIAIQEASSFTKAASYLHLTQPAISAQIKRLQQLVGGDVFTRSGLGIVLTEKGEVVSRYARRILAMNDQILSLSGARPTSDHFRVGIPNVYAGPILEDLVKACRGTSVAERIQFCCEPSGDLMKGLVGGYLDLAFIVSCDPSHMQRLTERKEKLVWVSAPDFILSPGAPVPILSFPNGLSDQIAIDALEAAGMQYFVAFVASDLAAQMAAIRVGLGYFVLPEYVVQPDLKIARDHYLPQLPDLTAGLYLRQELDPKRLMPLIDCLDGVLNQARKSSPDAMQSGAKPQVAARTNVA